MLSLETKAINIGKSSSSKLKYKQYIKVIVVNMTFQT